MSECDECDHPEHEPNRCQRCNCGSSEVIHLTAPLTAKELAFLPLERSGHSSLMFYGYNVGHRVPKQKESL